MPTKTEDLKDTRPEKSVKNPSPERVKWDLIKTYMKSNDFESARKMLIELTDHTNPFNVKATKMLRELDK